jgi:hypothetical protein
MITARQLARAKQRKTSLPNSHVMGPYNHHAQRRWIGEDASLIQWTMKSDTMHDGESTDPDPEVK